MKRAPVGVGRFAVAAAGAALLITRAFACGGNARNGTTDASADDDAGPLRDVGVNTLPDGGAATGSDSATTNASLLSDPTIWSRVAQMSDCTVLDAKIAPDPFPRRAWSTCGTGCQVADAALPIDEVNAASSAASRGGITTAGETYLQLGLETKAGTFVQQVLRLSDGATVAAMELPSATGCFPPASTGDTPLMFNAVHLADGGVATGMFGRVRPGQSTLWQNRPIVVSQQVTTFMSGDALGYGLYPEEVGLLHGLDDTGFTYLGAGGTGALYAVSGRGAIVTWAKNTGSGGSLWAWTAAAGEQHLYSAAGKVVSIVRMSDDKTVWTETTGPSAPDGAYDTSQLMWAASAGQASGFAPTAGPMLGAGVGLVSLAVGEDYAATIMCTAMAGPCSILVVQFSTSHVWTIHARPGGNAFVRVLSVSPTEIVASEVGNPKKPQESFSRIVRLSTSQLDALQAAW